MGGCCSCCGGGGGGGHDGNNGEPTAAEMEMQQREAAKSLQISRKMSSPALTIATSSEDSNNNDSGSVVTGHGLGIVGVALEQDAAYWEWHISLSPRQHVDTTMFGVTSQKGPEFYSKLKDKEPNDEEEGVPSEANGTNWMRKVEVQDGDVVGVAMQQSDLPMVQFFHNGEPLHELAINRFRGTVYPAVCLPRSAVELQLKVTAVMLESKFKQLSPGPRFGPIIVARSIV